MMRRSQSAEESAKIWKGRKAAFGAIGQLSDYYCMDGVIPLSKLPKALDEIGWICRRYRFDVANIFHAGDGNLHPLILYNANDPLQLERVELCGAEILKLCVELGGCLTGEHGVGIEKRELMRVQFYRGGSRAADAGQGGLRSRLAAQSRQGVSAGRDRTPSDRSYARRLPCSRYGGGAGLSGRRGGRYAHAA